MRVQVRDLVPNPFRDMDRYPIDEEKVKRLIKSIKSTGFWDNILARAADDKYEIAYGHHRLEALRRANKPTDFVDIPFRDLDDATMIRIMANENDEGWGTNVAVVDETVRVTKLYLDNHPEVAKKYWGSTRPMEAVGKAVISRFLNGNWNETRVGYSLERLRLIEEGKLDKEAVESMPSERAARNLTQAVKETGIDKTAQRNVAEMVAKGRTGAAEILHAAFNEKYKGDEKKRMLQEFGEFIEECAKDMRKLNKKLETLIKFKEDFDSTVYAKGLDRLIFDIQVKSLLMNLARLGKKDVKEKDVKDVAPSPKNLSAKEE